jgi:hypothetical protein
LTASTLGRSDFTRLSLDEPNIFLANLPTLTINGPFNPDDAGFGPAGSATEILARRIKGRPENASGRKVEGQIRGAPTDVNAASRLSGRRNSAIFGPV